MACISEVRYLVRDLLGCTCPDEVFDDIELRWRGGARALDLRLAGRLLVHLRWPADTVEAEDALASWLDEGRTARDRGGFNRFRLLLALVEAGPGADRLRECFAELCRGDDRLHLHLLPASVLAGLVGD